jgi:hypothetical protein
MNIAEAKRQSLADLMSDVEGAVHKAEAGLTDQLQGTAASGVPVPESRVHPHILLLASECGGGALCHWA